jgi:predicted nucleic acid-binding protein
VSVFLDTNVLLYADDADAGPKAECARALIRRCMVDRTGVLSTQVLQEYYVNARKKLRMDGAAARARVELYLAFEVITLSPALLIAAVDLHRLDSVSFWDALIIRAAEQAGCDTLYSEDLQPGRRFGAVRVVNPFA